MKKIRLLLATLVVMALFFSGCQEKSIIDYDHAVKVEIIDNTWLALNPHNITKKIESNPRNIFLEIKSLNDSKDRMQANWYRKTNGTYQLFCINDTGRKLNQDLAYEVMDTLNLSENIIDYRNKYPDSIDLAYQGKTIIINNIFKRKYLEEYPYTKVKITSRDSVLKYNPETKSFFYSTTYPVTELKNDFGPIIIFVIFFIFTLVISLRDRIKLLKKLKEKILQYDYWGIYDNHHQLNSLILFLVLFLFNFIYTCYWDATEYCFFKAIISATLIGFSARLIFWLDKIKIKSKDGYDYNLTLSIILISTILMFENFIVIGMPENFSLITSIIVTLPAMLDVILFEIEKKRLRNNKD